MPLGYCKVRVNITALVKDGNDSDIAPDDQALSGQLKLVPMVKPGTPLQYDDAGRKKLKVLTTLDNIEIGPMGDIVNGATDFVTVPAPDASNTNVASLQWQAVFVNPKYGNKIVQINDIYFWAVAGVDIDLADQVNTAPSSTAVQITRGPRGFGVVDVQTEADELVFFAGPQDDPEAWLEAGRALLPTGGGLTVEQIADAAGDTETPLGEVLANSYAPLWQPSTAYAINAPVLLPNGSTGKRTAAGTSRAQFDATELALWTVASGLPSGGTTGQVPVKTADGVAWGTPAAASIVVSENPNQAITAGQVLFVVEPSAFTPASLSPMMWFDSLEVAAGAMTTWADLSGNGRNLALASGAGAVATDNAIGTRRAALFGGATHYTTPALPSLSGTDVTVFVVGHIPLTTTQVFVGGPDGTSNRFEIGKSGSENWIMSRAGQQLTSASDQLNNGAPHLFCAEFTAANTGKLEVDTAVPHNGSALSSASTLSTMLVGARNRGGVDAFLKGTIGTLLVFNRLLTTTEKANLKTFLRSRWGLA
ncbi:MULTISPECIES: hypothetical protein [unclassified Rhodococcus (in: high G+C Gram-positive bacteria)]|uniref:hypothetical protein n=1 Tax=unclassified Rhodococcus (in: high G+C Gram-positive bacteria) TaxID=192944 RepID=UPI000B9B0FF0|nr:MULTISPECIES: hypothetical protein [unclassified Rhodococcus (in: high G+C Gram-positive bacteria)]OZE35587.1 hypothetical protein CH259_16290 [Rhodococcus sp. 05-2254-4]OZE48016.1 hypothetical protein CH261_08885 [Rhodococcus sp. 05-2254-3]OZE49227.1 hypothetical protein CH283_16670 [Rhodococcus sp. 05-2254-2]